MSAPERTVLAVEGLSARGALPRTGEPVGRSGGVPITTEGHPGPVTDPAEDIRPAGEELE